MNIVLDTNVLHDDYFLKNTQLTCLIEESSAKLFIPKVVVDEHIGHYKKDCENLRNQHSTTEELERILGLPSTEEFIDVKVSVNQYKDTLMDRLKELNIEILSYPKTSHEKVVERIYEKKKPFGVNKKKKEFSEKGYKDYLIWESILKLAKEIKEPIYFVTRNPKDFGDGNDEKYRLHKDFIEDLNDIGIDTNNIKLFSDLEKLLSQLGLECDERDEEISPQDIQKYTPEKLLDLSRPYLNYIRREINYSLPNLFGIDALIGETKLVGEPGEEFVNLLNVYQLESGLYSLIVDLRILLDIELETNVDGTTTVIGLTKDYLILTPSINLYRPLIYNYSMKFTALVQTLIAIDYDGENKIVKWVHVLNNRLFSKNDPDWKLQNDK